jgi:hypothetical protein
MADSPQPGSAGRTVPPPLPDSALMPPDPSAELELLVRSRYPLLVIESFEEERVEALLQRLAARMRIPLGVWTLSEGLRHAGTGSVVYETREPAAALTNLAGLDGDGLWLFKGLQKHFEQADVLRLLQDFCTPAQGASRPGAGNRALVLTGAPLPLPAELERLAARFRLELPGPAELTELARDVAARLQSERKIRFDITKGDFRRLVDGLRGFTLFEAERALSRAILDDDALTKDDIVRLASIKQERVGQDGILELVPAETGGAGGGFGPVGGLAGLRSWIAKRARALTPEARAFGVAPPRGLVLLGVQGCGKTMAARAIAGEWSLPLLRLEPGRLYDRYVGESEKSLDRAIQVAERMAPCVLLVDEIEKGFASAGSSDADGGLSRRLFGRLLGWLQDREAPVFIVATCNAVAELPPELMRKGRFDEIFFLDLPGPADRAAVFGVQLSRRRRDPAAFDLAALAAASDGFSGAEIEQAVVSGLMSAFSRGGAFGTDTLLDECRATVPLSVTRREEIEALRAWAHGRAVRAN